jgi:Holliday junction resolvase
MGEPSTGREFEDEVASLCQAHGFQIQREANLAGSQVDLLATGATSDGQKRIAVECKLMTHPVSISQVNSYAKLVDFWLDRASCVREA